MAMCATVIPLRRASSLTYYALYLSSGWPDNKVNQGSRTPPLFRVSCEDIDRRSNEVCPVHSILGCAAFRSSLRDALDRFTNPTATGRPLRSCHCFLGGMDLDLV